MGMVHQFQDLTEYSYCPVPKNKVPVYSPDAYFKPDAIQTEFTFWLAAPYSGISQAEECGFKHVSSMNNWWPSHKGETRTLKLMWLKKPDAGNLGIAPCRKRWCYGDGSDKWEPITCDLAGYGCGFKLVTPPLKKQTLEADGWYKFFTLLRMPLEKLKPEEMEWMKDNHFRFLDSGKLAQYWVNGWEPEKYTPAKEYKFFNTTKEEWGKKGMKGWED